MREKKSKFIVLTTAVILSAGFAQAQLVVNDVLNTYYRVPVLNNWHTGVIEMSGTTLQWRNDDNISWPLIPDLANDKLLTTSQCPYFTTPGGDAFILKTILNPNGSKTVEGYWFLNDLYTTSLTPPQQGYNGLAGYISSYYQNAAPAATYGEGFGFYSAIWPLIEKPIAHFQIGLPSTWLDPNNSDNSTVALCPVGTYARDNWPERGPTWASVFQTVEGGPGYWTGNRFHYGPPKFKMNSTPNCYSQEISTPSWGFFGNQLTDNMLGIAQLSNQILIPMDGMPFQGNPAGDLLGISYMALPLTKAYKVTHPVGEKSWTCFLNSQNFKGPIACYLPETWAKISINYSFDYGRGLDARRTSTDLGGGTMEINTVPKIVGTDNNGIKYYKIPKLQYPINSQNRSVISKDAILYNSSALYNDVIAWRNGGAAPSGLFNMSGSNKPVLATGSVTYKQDNLPVKGINEKATPAVFNGNEFGLQWSGTNTGAFASFPEYYRDSSGFRVAVNPSTIPSSTGLISAQFTPPNSNPTPYNVPMTGAWANPGPVLGPYYVNLVDGSRLTYYWYKFIDQPVFQQYNFSKGKKDSLQALIESMHTNWTKNKSYMPNPSSGTLVSFDPALLVTPPSGYEVGYVPLVTRQEKNNVTTGIAQNSNQQTAIHAYPNPNNGTFTLEIGFTDNGSYKLEISNVLGQIIYSESLNINSRNYNFSKQFTLVDLPKSVYVIKLSGNGVNENKKIIIE